MNAVLDLYVQWLNMWLKADKWTDDVPPYTRDAFIVMDPDRSLWGSSKVLSTTEAGYHDILVIEANDGDDGGPAILVAWLSEGVVTHIVQEFDTHVQTIYDTTTAIDDTHKPFQHTPEEA